MVESFGVSTWRSIERHGKSCKILVSGKHKILDVVASNGTQDSNIEVCMLAILGSTCVAREEWLWLLAIISWMCRKMRWEGKPPWLWWGREEKFCLLVEMLPFLISRRLKKQKGDKRKKLNDRTQQQCSCRCVITMVRSAEHWKTITMSVCNVGDAQWLPSVPVPRIWNCKKWLWHFLMTAYDQIPIVLIIWYTILLTEMFRANKLGSVLNFQCYLFFPEANTKRQCSCSAW